MSRFAVPFMFFLASGACATLQHPALQVSNETALVDERLDLTVENLNPGQTVIVRATTLDQRRWPWMAEAIFVAGPDGKVALAEQAPLSGSYEGADAMGLFWSAKPEVEGAIIAHRPGIEYVTIVETLINEKVVDRDTVVRRFDAAGLTRESVNEGPVRGALYRPKGAGSFPAVVVFAGSDGGLGSAEWRAAMLASRGFTALAVAYFKYPGRPDYLMEIPLEDAASVVDWLVKKEDVARVGVVGFSKGSELALSLAARDSCVGAVVAVSPTAYVWPGISDSPPEKRSSWTWQGRPLPTIPWTIGPASGQMLAEGPPFRFRVLYEESLQAASGSALLAASIPVERIQAPVLLVSGGDDGSWPASKMSEAIVARMHDAGKAEKVTHLDYPEAGHLILWDYLPTTVSVNPGQVFGGSAAATSAARADSWPKIQEFLREALNEN